jgi:hypothetical protein
MNEIRKMQLNHEATKSTKRLLVREYRETLRDLRGFVVNPAFAFLMQ